MRELFEQTLPLVLGERVTSSGRSGVLRVRLPGPVEWEIDFSACPVTCKASNGRAADCELSMDEDTLEALVARPERAQELASAKRVTVGGAMPELATSFWEALVFAHQPCRLERLFMPLAKADVVARWQSEPLTCHGPRERFDTWLGLPALDDIHSLLRSWRGTVGLHRGISDTTRAVVVSSARARRALRRGCNLAFEHMELQFPELRPWLAQLAADLAMPASARRKCVGYFSSGGLGTVAHFDDNTNIVLQLQGEKLWHFAPNRHVTNPCFRYLTGPGPGKPLGFRPDLQYRAMPTEMPSEMPTEGRVSILAKPGTVLVVPRGWWHDTLAHTDSLSINFWFTSPSWAGLALQALANQLITDPRWRELASGAGGTGAVRAAAVARLDALLTELPQMAATLDATSIFAASRRDDPFPQFRWPEFPSPPLVEWKAVRHERGQLRTSSAIRRALEYFWRRNANSRETRQLR